MDIYNRTNRNDKEKNYEKKTCFANKSFVL